MRCLVCDQRAMARCSRDVDDAASRRRRSRRGVHPRRAAHPPGNRCTAPASARLVRARPASFPPGWSGTVQKTSSSDLEQTRLGGGAMAAHSASDRSPRGHGSAAQAARHDHEVGDTGNHHAAARTGDTPEHDHGAGDHHDHDRGAHDQSAAHARPHDHADAYDHSRDDDHGHQHTDSHDHADKRDTPTVTAMTTVTNTEADRSAGSASCLAGTVTVRRPPTRRSKAAPRASGPSRSRWSACS